SSVLTVSARLVSDHFFLNDPSPSVIYTLSLHDALPIYFDELISRIRALTRRRQYEQLETPKAELQFGQLHINRDQYKVTLAGQSVDLSPREYKLLIYLVENIGKTVSRVQILNAVWGITFDNHTNVVDVYISYLRSKIEKQDEKYIFTVKGVGYMFKG